jgi:hypothetical protein
VVASEEVVDALELSLVVVDSDMVVLDASLVVELYSEVVLEEAELDSELISVEVALEL